MMRESIRQDTPTVLWWSRSGRDYSRDRIIRQGMRSLGWTIRDFQPVTSQAGDIEAAFRRVDKADLVWVPCFRHRDVAAATRWSARRNIPVIFDPLISAWDKQVFERCRFASDSSAARRLKRWEQRLLQKCDHIVADTDGHATLFREQLGVDAERLSVVPVGAEDGLFSPQPPPENARPHVLFYGSFIGLQGPQFIATAAQQVPEMDWTFVGSGPLLTECRKILAHASHVKFVPRVAYESLPSVIGSADILMGVFGTSAKAGRVVPNKVYQALACARGVVTQRSDAYPSKLRGLPFSESGIKWVAAGDGDQIAQAVRDVTADTEDSADPGAASRRTFESWFSKTVIEQSLSRTLSTLHRRAGKRSAAA